MDKEQEFNNYGSKYTLKHERIYTVEECSIQECAFESTLKEEPVRSSMASTNKYVNVRQILEKMFIEIRGMLQQLRSSC
jgi:hypothetical protein